MLSLVKSKSGLNTLKYKNKYIHSKYDPLREAKTFISNNKDSLNNDSIVIIGLGLGYNINQILENFNNVKNIYVFEYSKDIVDLCIKENAVLLKNDKVNIISKEDDFYNELNDKLKKVDDVIIHKPSLEMLKDLNSKLYDILKTFQINKESINQNKDMLLQNKKYNESLNLENINSFVDEKIFKNNKKTLILAAGPSLDFDIENILKHKDEFNIIAVGSVFKRIMEKNIVPDFVVIIDGNEIVVKQFLDNLNSRVPLCFLNTASRWTIEKYNGPKYIFYNDTEDEYEIKTGKTVAVAAINLAIKFGAKNIALLGQDLTSINGKTHIESYCKIYDIKGEENLNDRVLDKDINGNEITTVRTYVYFKNRIEETIKENKSVKFYNCSKGLFIKGATHIEFKEYLKRGL
ncbi:6-hydroxymethylpterin diphosphokinase MptE-like protein [Clostridium chrysemydis]|uniref:motility associated factor glycosyltransferase family protein n=1 Tax=Clostridium chrysemydis TaxID=2665504 RepID=UPI00188345C5|nr:6-hydroxymethylpterin diphosphokinase MptE-like protein [Clostridium chrysemydis]